MLPLVSDSVSIIDECKSMAPTVCKACPSLLYKHCRRAAPCMALDAELWLLDQVNMINGVIDDMLQEQSLY
jgi:hypothetical protein